MKVLIVSLLLFSFWKSHAEERRENAAHVHGNAQLSIAFEGVNGEIHFDGAGEGVIGFEHPAKSDKDKKIVADSLRTMESQIGKFLIFDPSLKCEFPSAHAKVVPEGNHSDVEADFKVKCAKSPVGSKLKVDYTKSFPLLKKLDVQILADQVQKSATLASFPAEIELK
jgi:hypothetical protein